ncbi:MAG: bifunctional diguanylate cyclase/phosphodiesterase [Devosia sp.]
MALNTSLAKQISGLSLLFAGVLLTALFAFGWWAASRIDDRSIARETRAVQTGLTEVASRIPVEQDSSAVWDDSVINLRANNEAWIAENLAEWMSQYFGHDRVYILDADNRPMRAVADGARVDASTYEDDRGAIEPLVTSLRAEMAMASAGAEDSTETITGLGTRDYAILGDGMAGIVSVRPIVPATDAVHQAPGTEYLHVSVRLIDKALIGEISAKYEVPALDFERDVQSDGAKSAIPLLTKAGRVIGFFTWVPEKPASQLIKETAPAIGIALAVAGAAVYLLLRRLRRTSSQLEYSKAEASFLAFHDPLTKIPNRALFEDRLEQALANMRRTGKGVALHYIDLDRFKHVNDTLGHPAGDALIRAAAGRLAGLVDQVDTVARLGGDEFALIQFQIDDTPTALTLAQRIVDAFEVPFILEGHTARIGASVGVVVATDGEADANDLMRQADIALYEAKDGGRGRYQLFEDSLDEAVKDRRALELDLQAALSTDEGLELVYQPIFDVRSGQIAGAEALVRWNHPSCGRLPPDRFIGLAEERGLIDQLGLWVMRRACQFAVSSQLPWIAVNVSPLQFRDERFAETVFEVLAETGLHPKRLEIEITESLLLQNSPIVQLMLVHLRASGIRVALDDFGTGYSSISYLRNHGVDKLKIDQSFTKQLGQDHEIDSIVRSIIELGRAMNMAVTAEGVETEAQRAVLTAMDCNQLQGYLLSRPLTPEKLTESFDTAPFAIGKVG